MGSKVGNALDQGRRSERLAIDAEARMRPNSWSSVEVRVVDISACGFRARCEARLAVGSGVSIDVPGIGAVDAQVEWQRGGSFGARFYRAIDLDRCEWRFADRPNPLARLLVERAAARAAGREGAEGAIRRQILQALPVRKIKIAG